jgi:hypothetical protein
MDETIGKLGVCAVIWTSDRIMDTEWKSRTFRGKIRSTFHKIWSTGSKVQMWGGGEILLLRKVSRLETDIP